jgi:hypothetical protein
MPGRREASHRSGWPETKGRADGTPFRNSQLTLDAQRTVTGAGNGGTTVCCVPGAGPA